VSGAAGGAPDVGTVVGFDAARLRNMALGAEDLTPVAVAVPEWGGTFYVRAMTGAERAAYESYVQGAGKGANETRERLVALGVCDAEGNRVFRDSDVAVLQQKSAAALDRLLDVILDVNGLSASAAEEEEKN
jgi:hypothetical protein